MSECAKVMQSRSSGYNAGRHVATNARYFWATVRVLRNVSGAARCSAFTAWGSLSKMINTMHAARLPDSILFSANRPVRTQ